MSYRKMLGEDDKLVRAVGKAYRSGQLSVPLIAEKYEVSYSTVYRWVRRHGWKRDLTTDVRVTAKRKAMVPVERLEQAKKAGQDVHTIPDAEIVEDFSEMGAAILREHRGLIGKLRARVESLLSRDLEVHRRYVRLVLKALDGKTLQDDGKGKVKLGGIVIAEFMGEQLVKQTAMTRDLAQTLARLIPLERQAFSLDNRDDERTYEQALKDLYESDPEPASVVPVGPTSYH